MHSTLKKIMMATTLCFLIPSYSHAFWASPRAFITAVGNVTHRFMQPIGNLASKVSSFALASKEKLGLAFAAITAKLFTAKKTIQAPVLSQIKIIPDQEAIPTLATVKYAQPVEVKNVQREAPQISSYAIEIPATLEEQSLSPVLTSFANNEAPLPIIPSILSRSRSKSVPNLQTVEPVVDLKRSKTVPVNLHEYDLMQGGQLQQAREEHTQKTLQEARELDDLFAQVLCE